ncbi:MAG: hypothetical protein JW822_08310 [Spirochaetales bacterium]|nr:hypothetical protein [Spirochaetales bacterium]
MGEYLDQIPSNIQQHIKGLAQSVKTEEGEDAVEKVAQCWLEKKAVFEDKISEMGMEEIDSLNKEDEKGAIALTYSGSLVNIGPLVDGARTVKYSSIGMRTDIPESAESDSSNLASDVQVDGIIQFEGGPVKSTSQIFKIAVCKDEEMSPEEQQQTIIETATIIEEEFVEVNKTIME